MSLYGILCPEEQKASVPTGVAKTAYQFHAMVLGQDLHNLIGHITSDGEGVEVVKITESQLSEAPCSCPVTFPRLWFHKKVVAEGRKMSQELPQAMVPMVQMNPHGY
jgi:hypothetical protein